MNKRRLPLVVLFCFCFSAPAQEPPPILELSSIPPSERLRSIAESLEELERSESASLEDLTKLKEDLTALEALLAASELTLAELRTQVDGVLERYETLFLRFEKQRKSLSVWKTGCLGLSGLSAGLLVLLCLF